MKQFIRVKDSPNFAVVFYSPAMANLFYRFLHEEHVDVPKPDKLSNLQQGVAISLITQGLALTYLEYLESGQDPDFFEDSTDIFEMALKELLNIMAPLVMQEDALPQVFSPMDVNGMTLAILRRC